MSEEILVQTNLTKEECLECGVVFALPCTLQEQREKDHESFFCPNGHVMTYPEKTKAEKLTDVNIKLSGEINTLQNQLRYWKGKANKVKK